MQKSTHKHIPENDVLFFSAHPDDAEFGCGGTLLMLAKRFKVVNVILTHGEAGTFGNPDVREKEAFAAGRFGGYSVEFLDFEDAFIDDNAANSYKLAAAIRKYRPKVVIAPYHTNNSSHTDGVSHPDHMATGRLAIKAARFAKFKNARIPGEPHLVGKLIYYMVPRFMKPSFMLDISAVADELPKLWACHDSQFNGLAKGKLEARLMAIRRYYSIFSPHSDISEAFIVDEPLKMDIDGLLKKEY
jgi:N-acetylglucosamine malate deacetylase 1